jgi:putative transposase
VADISRELGINKLTFYFLKNTYAGMNGEQLRLKELKEDTAAKVKIFYKDTSKNLCNS